MAFPVPVDARAAKNFEIIKGGDEVLIHSMPIYDTTKAIAIGEWVKPVNDGGVVKAGKLITGVDTSAAPAMGARASWTKYVPSDMNAGQADAQATKQVDVLKGPYIANTKLVDSAITGTPGNILVAIYEAANDRGVLLDIAPASVTTRQLQAMVGRVVGYASGVLTYESSI